MTQVKVLDAVRDRAGGCKVDVSRRERIGRVSSEWFSRPDDERYLSLSELFAAVRGRTDRSRTRTVESAAIRVDASRDDAERRLGDDFQYKNSSYAVCNLIAMSAIRGGA